MMIREITRLSKVPRQEIEAVLQELCGLRLVRRLNTIIPSYVAGPVASV